MFSLQLKKIRENAGYSSQQSFADAFGVAQSTVGGWEAGKREPNFATTIRLAKFFSVSVDELLGNNVSKPANIAFSLNSEERAIIAAYRNASDVEQLIIRHTLKLDPPQSNSNQSDVG